MIRPVCLLPVLRFLALLPVFVVSALPINAKTGPGVPVLVTPAPVRVEDERSVNPSGKKLGFFSGTSAETLGKLRASPGLGAVQDFNAFVGKAAKGTGFVVDHPAPAPDLLFVYEGSVTAMALATNATYATSVQDGSSLRLQASGPGEPASLGVQFGTWRAGAFVTNATVKGVAFTLTGNYANFQNHEVVVRFLDAFGRELSRQTYVNTTSVDSKAGAAGPVSACVAYLNPGNDPSRNIGGVTVGFTAGENTGPFILALDDFGTTPVVPVP
jgi:hypothetical protein